MLTQAVTLAVSRARGLSLRCPCLGFRPRGREALAPSGAQLARWGATGCVCGMDVKHRNKRIYGLGTCYGWCSEQRSRHVSHGETEKRAVGGDGLKVLPAAGWFDRPSGIPPVTSKGEGDDCGVHALQLTWSLMRGDIGGLSYPWRRLARASSTRHVHVHPARARSWCVSSAGKRIAGATTATGRRHGRRR